MIYTTMYASGQSVLLADYVKARLVQDAASDNYHMCDIYYIHQLIEGKHHKHKVQD